MEEANSGPATAGRQQAADSGGALTQSGVAGHPSSTADRSPVRGRGETGAAAARKRGGGPRTAAGRAVVRRNPPKHGVLAQTPVIPLVERSEDWEALRSGIFAYFEVEGAMEEELADRIAGYAWRLRRASRAETGAVSQALRDVPEDWRFDRALKGLPKVRRPGEEHIEEMNRMLMERLAPSVEVMERIGRYEKGLVRQQLQTIQQLLVLKGWRGTGGGKKYEVGGRRDDGGPVVSVKGYERRGVNRRVDRAPLDAVRGDAGGGKLRGEG